MPSSTLAQPETPYLFLYGTLMPSAVGHLGSARRERLAAVSQSLGPASMAGRLYDLGLYPGIMVSGFAGDRVYGEAVRLLQPDDVFRWLDPYEGLMADGASRFNFERSTTAVELATGDAVTA